MKISHLAVVVIIPLLLGSPLGAWQIPGVGKKSDVPSAEKTDVATLSKSLAESVAAAQTSLGGSNPDLTMILSKALNDADKGDDLALLDQLKGLMDLPDGSVVTPSQKELLREVQGHAQALVLSRNFSDDPALAGPVRDAIKAVQSRDPLAAASSLKVIAEKGSLTPMQQNLLKSMLGEYSAYLDAAQQATGALNSVRSLF